MLNIKIYGIVQGVGFRPFVARLAKELNILGTVANKGSYVEIFAEGEENSLKKFTEELKTKAPVRAAILSMGICEIENSKRFDDFSIIESEKEYGKIFVSPDIAICDDCKRELYDKTNRRYLHPFINCTLCGPRLTITEAAPYDRERTSMADFPFCPDCEREYYDEKDRRYDAQPVCCNNCGPKYYILNGDKKEKDALRKTRDIIKDGGIAAIKGIGGFHLSCDASNFEAVAKLRERKRRPMKPFALMVKDIETLEKIVKIPKGAVPIITGPQKPILLLPRKENSLVAPNVAEDNPYLGVMLPYAPIQCLLFEYEEIDEDFPKVLVMTSGNPSGAPICHTDEEANDALSSIADVILSNNRRIRLRSDDSVMSFFENKPYMIRRSRGYAPIPITVGDRLKGEVLAVGGELKNTFCLAKDELFYPSPFIGDMSDLRSVTALKDSINLMESLLEINPKIVACDMHPRYNTTSVAKGLNLPLFFVQHHYAHILSCMAENNEFEPVLGIAFDGTGYGTDNTVWGGEILLCDTKNFERISHIEPFIQAGGDKVPRECYRVALAFLFEEYNYNEAKVSQIAQRLNIATADEVSAINFMLKNNVNCIKSTSAGRLFDGASAILGVRKTSTYEGEGAIYLEFAANHFEKSNLAQAKNILDNCVKNALNKNTVDNIETKYIMKRLLNEKLNNKSSEELAYYFHAALASEILSSSLIAREKCKISTIALSGGCFQNLLFTSLTKNLLENHNFKVLTHKLIPPNDGGIALGQAFAAMVHLKNQGG